MQNNMAIFKHELFGQLRVATEADDGEPLFVARDVCNAPDLGNPRSSLALLDVDEKAVHTVDTPGGAQEMLTITEAGLYSLILRSRKPEAKTFKRWVTHEVLPSIRKNGGYLVSKPDDTPDTVIARALLLAG